MPRTRTGTIEAHRWKDGRTVTYRARFPAYGRRWRIDFGTNHEGWSEQRARVAASTPGRTHGAAVRPWPGEASWRAVRVAVVGGGRAASAAVAGSVDRVLGGVQRPLVDVDRHSGADGRGEAVLELLEVVVEAPPTLAYE
jgi:hypothetical protein